MALSKTTQDHDEIREWAEARGGKPADVASTEKNGQTGIIRIEFPGAVHANDSALKEISWDEFFEKFDASGLALVYQEQTAEGATSNFNKLVHPENVSASAKKSTNNASAKKGAKTSAPAKQPASGRKSGSGQKATPAKKSISAKKSAAPAKSTFAKKAAPARKDVPAKKSAAKAAPVKAPAGKKTTAKASANKAPAKQTTAKKAPAKKSTGVKRSKR